MELKSAWFTILVVGTALVLGVLMGVRSGFPAAFAPLGLLGLLGLVPFLFRKGRGTPGCDERDLEIVKKATLLGGMCSYLVVVAGSMAIWFIHFSKGAEEVSIQVLPGLVAVAAIALYLARSLFIMSQYSSKALGSDE